MAPLEQRLPGAVALPRDAEQVAACVRLAADAGVPYVARGAGTNLCGGSVPAEGGLVIHLAGLNRILSIDPDRKRAWVEPGLVNAHLTGPWPLSASSTRRTRRASKPALWAATSGPTRADLIA